MKLVNLYRGDASIGMDVLPYLDGLREGLLLFEKIFSLRSAAVFSPFFVVGVVMLTL